jgi:hypothetical protein
MASCPRKNGKQLILFFFRNEKEGFMRRFVWAIPILAMTVFFCSNYSRDNPADSRGNNYHPPVVKILKDPIIGSDIDSVQLFIRATDDNGIVEAIEWSLDNKDFKKFIFLYNPTLLLPKPGSYTIYIRAIDNNSVPSAVESLTVIIKQAPVVVRSTIKAILNDTSTLTMRTAKPDTSNTQWPQRYNRNKYP